MDIVISPGNSKLGKRVFNISLPPEKACAKDAPCKETCYSRKAWLMYPNVRKAWTTNWEAFMENPDEYFSTISDTCREKKIEQFRWHVAGDIPNGFPGTYTYLLGMARVAHSNPNVQFLCFTKNKVILDVSLTALYVANLKFIFSMWPGLLGPTTTKAYAEGLAPVPLAWYKPKVCKNQTYNEAMEEVAINSTECSGRCDGCFKCWHMEPSMSVILEEH